MVPAEVGGDGIGGDPLDATWNSGPIEVDLSQTPTVNQSPDIGVNAEGSPDAGNWNGDPEIDPDASATDESPHGATMKSMASA